MTQPTRLPRIAILGGGMAGLTAAWELSSGAWRDRYDGITVYQRGWRLGGKGASSRGRNSRIEEHGLHVLLGYYHDTFRVMRDCYEELDRPKRRPDCPILTWEDAVKPSSTVGLTESEDFGWHSWSMSFPERPGMPGRRDASDPLDPTAAAIQSLRLLASFYAATHQDSAGPTVTTSPEAGDPSQVLRGIGLTVLAGMLSIATRLEANGSAANLPGLGMALERGLGTIRARLAAPLQNDAVGSVTWGLVDLVMTNLAGIVGDRLLTRPEGFSAIDDMDYRAWLERHGAAPETVESAIVRGMYDLVFAYRAGDRQRPAFAAGLGLRLATQMLLGYDGSLFWKMQAGMGEAIFAPLYEALRDRGVSFEFFNRVDDIHVKDSRIDGISIGRQVELVGDEYQPLIDAGGLPAWPDRPLAEQLATGGDWLAGSESFHGERRDVGGRMLRAGEDFDFVVFAASVGIIPEVARELIAADPRWRSMVDNVATVGTQAFQLWLTEDEKALGWSGGSGVTLSGFAPPFDTWASMTHLIDREGWPDEAEIEAIAYFCGSIAEDAPSDEDSLQERVRSYIETELKALWPAAFDLDGNFRWQALDAPGDAVGPERLTAQYIRANVDPSDRYVQSLPGTDRYRLSPGDSGFANLVLAGDWTDCGLNAGCVEAATRSGILAAAAVAERAAATTEVTK